MIDLSPAAQAVLDAAFPVYDEEEHLYVLSGEQHARKIAAAALRAAANGCDPDWLALAVIHHLHAIADELEAQR
jgi:hypothetical protein